MSRTLRVQESQSGIRSHIDRHWVTIAIGIMIIIVLGGLLSGRLLSPAFFELRKLASLVHWPTLHGLAGLGRLTSPERTPPPPAGEQSTPGFDAFLALVLVAGFVLALITLFVKRHWLANLLSAILGYGSPNPGEQVTERRESIFSWNLLWDQLRMLLQGMRRPPPPPVFVELGPGEDPRRAIRQIYQDVLAWAMARDLPRRKSETPTAYVGTLSRLCPQEVSSLQILTLAYIMARYGALPPTLEQLQAAQEAYVRIALALQVSPSVPGVA